MTKFQRKLVSLVHGELRIYAKQNREASEIILALQGVTETSLTFVRDKRAAIKMMKFLSKAWAERLEHYRIVWEVLE